MKFRSDGKITDTLLPGTLDKIIKHAILTTGLKDERALMRHLNRAKVLAELDKRLPDWRTLTSSKPENREKYIKDKLNYRIKKRLPCLLSQLR